MLTRFALSLLLSLAALPAGAITLGQTDDFSSLQFWQRGVLAAPGAGGASDPFLQLDSDGVSQGGNLVSFNQAQWSGDYLAAGVTRITLLLSNLGGSALDVRLAFGDSNAPRLSGSWYSTLQAVTLAPGSGWTAVSFDIGAGDLVLTNGSAGYAQVMSNVFTLRILHSSSPSSLGQSVIGTLGIDTISAVPEPSLAAMLGAAALFAIGKLRRR